jgi:hypothetical protein
MKEASMTYHNVHLCQKIMIIITRKFREKDTVMYNDTLTWENV